MAEEVLIVPYRDLGLDPGEILYHPKNDLEKSSRELRDH
jgi:hypothetical protein